MSVKNAFPSALVLTFLSLCAAHGQTPPGLPSGPEVVPPPAVAAPEGVPSGPAMMGPDGPPAGPSANGPATLSEWIRGQRPWYCCGPLGGNGPVMSEIYMRTGAAFNLGSTGVLGATLQTGWVIEGGGRSLFFNPEQTAAWTLDFGITNIINHGKNPNIMAPITVLVPDPNPAGNNPPKTVRFGVDVPGVTIRDLNRTFVNLGAGREWYLSGCANSSGRHWRAGLDVGGRYGTASLQLEELRHRTDVIGGVWAAAHSDLEIPWGCYRFIAGIRLQWAYTWSDILQQQNDADVMDLSLLVNLGVRF